MSVATWPTYISRVGQKDLRGPGVVFIREWRNDHLIDIDLTVRAGEDRRGGGAEGRPKKSASGGR